MTNRTTARRFIPASEMPDEGDRAYLARAGGVRVASPEDRAGQGERRRRLAPPRSSTHRGDRLAKARHRATSGRVDAWSCDAGGTRHLPAPQIRSEIRAAFVAWADWIEAMLSQHSKQRLCSL
jgi:hypothetical protein